MGARPHRVSPPPLCLPLPPSPLPLEGPPLASYLREVSESLCQAINSLELCGKALGRVLRSPRGPGGPPVRAAEQHNLNPDRLYFRGDGDIRPLLLSFCIKDLPLIKLINNCWLGAEYLDF